MPQNIYMKVISHDETALVRIDLDICCSQNLYDTVFFFSGPADYAVNDESNGPSHSFGMKLPEPVSIQQSKILLPFNSYFKSDQEHKNIKYNKYKNNK